MPRILEFKEINGAMWARIDLRGEEPSPVYLWTQSEAKAAKASAIRSFCFDFANQYIEDPNNNLAEPE